VGGGRGSTEGHKWRKGWEEDYARVVVMMMAGWLFCWLE